MADCRDASGRLLTAGQHCETHYSWLCQDAIAKRLRQDTFLADFEAGSGVTVRPVAYRRAKADAHIITRVELDYEGFQRLALLWCAARQATTREEVHS